MKQPPPSPLELKIYQLAAVLDLPRPAQLEHTIESAIVEVECLRRDRERYLETLRKIADEVRGFHPAAVRL